MDQLFNRGLLNDRSSVFCTQSACSILTCWPQPRRWHRRVQRRLQTRPKTYRTHPKTWSMTRLRGIWRRMQRRPLTRFRTSSLLRYLGRRRTRRGTFEREWTRSFFFKRLATRSLMWDVYEDVLRRVSGRVRMRRRMLSTTRLRSRLRTHPEKSSDASSNASMSMSTRENRA